VLVADTNACSFRAVPTGRGATIRAAVSRGVGLPPSIENLHLDAPGPDEVRVVVEACAVCHSDLSYVDGTWATDFPLVLGHEASGRVADVGHGVHDLSTHDPVVVSLVRTCGECRACRKGHEVACTGNLSLNDRSPLSDADGNRIPQGLNVAAFATQVVVHRSQVVRLPDGFDLIEASLLGCSVLTGSGAVTNTASGPGRRGHRGRMWRGGRGRHPGGPDRRGRTDPGRDPEADKRKAALGFGATHTVDPVGDDVAVAIRSATGGRLADHLLVTTGAPAALDGAIDLLAPMGQLVIVGMPGDDVTIDVAPSWLAAANKSILGSKMGGARVSVDVPALLDHHRAGRLDLGGMVSTTHPLDELEEAFGEVRRGEVLRTVILPNGSGDRDPVDAPGVPV